MQYHSAARTADGVIATLHSASVEKMIVRIIRPVSQSR
jgi:hypothetical protein